MNFVFVGGDVSVDFSNTIKIVNGSKTDLLASPSSLYNWTQQLELDIPYESLDVNFQYFKSLRNLIHNCFQDFAYKRKINKEHLNKFNDFIRQFDIHPNILPGLPMFPSLSYESKQIDSPLLHHIVKSFLDVITDEYTLDRLKPCENDECVLLFVDKSKNKARRWCSMTTCGNKIKASRFYYRKR
ncbi:CGNR zinc finger domain-containing protein [Aneurinibacillus terranovensis]|uniref:CGNR zinc finger domain-containing protein n=1 Tax=Aneurinibacillus terranovensis TaxID=278991 RepID=UPI003CCBC53B